MQKSCDYELSAPLAAHPAHAAGLQNPHPGCRQAAGLKILAGELQQQPCTLIAGLASCTPLTTHVPHHAGQQQQVCQQHAAAAGQRDQVCGCHRPAGDVCRPVSALHQPHAGCLCKAAAADCLQVERLEVENLRAVGLRNKMAAMHEVSTGFGISNPHMQEERDVHARTCCRSHGSCVGYTGAAAQAARAAATAEGEAAGARQVTWGSGAWCVRRWLQHQR